MQSSHCLVLFILQRRGHRKESETSWATGTLRCVCVCMCVCVCVCVEVRKLGELVGQDVRLSPCMEPNTPTHTHTHTYTHTHTPQCTPITPGNYTDTLLSQSISCCFKHTLHLHIHTLSLTYTSTHTYTVTHKHTHCIHTVTPHTHTFVVKDGKLCVCVYDLMVNHLFML